MIRWFKRMSFKQKVLLTVAGIPLAICLIYYYMRPVQYPAGWPLSYVRVPTVATAGLLPHSGGVSAGFTEVNGWQTSNFLSGNRIRNFRVGFNYIGSFDMAAADLERRLKGYGWVRDHRDGSTANFHQPKDGRLSISLQRRIDYLFGLQGTPLLMLPRWELEIIELAQADSRVEYSGSGESLD